LVSKDAEPYNACPYCLTKIVAEGGSPVAGAKLVSEEREIGNKDETVRPVGDEMADREPKAGCEHYLGYLSDRSTKEKIPEECIVCDDVVKCMLKTVKD
jgi:hypothetical protein